MSMYKRKEVRQVVLISLGFIALLSIAKLWRWILQGRVISESELDLLSGILTRLPIFVLLIYLIKKFHFDRFIGLGNKVDLKSAQSIIIPMVFISVGFIGSFSNYVDAGGYLLGIFIVNTLLVALIEEFTFRGLVLPLLIKLNGSKKNQFFIGVVMSSAIFGVLHYVNLIRQPDNFWGITSQVVFAVSIGIFLGGLMLRTRHILFSTVIHFFVNFSFGSGDLKETAVEAVTESNDSGGLDGGTIITLLLFLFIAAGGWYTTRLADKSAVLESLQGNASFGENQT